jgi:succinyl-diaminopimelate desuccinylase
VIDVLTGWMRGAGLVPRVLSDAAGPVAVVTDVSGNRPGLHVVLDACLDTASLGDEAAWTVDPFGGVVCDGWLYGRGAADSKSGVAVFAHLAAGLAAAARHAGRLTVLCDLDEHTGGFAGIRRYLQDEHPDAVMIGYPGQDRIITGGRGVLRARLRVHGEAGHTGSSRPVRNALVKASRLVDLLTTSSPTDVDPLLALPPKVTVTSIHGGTPGVFSVVPDAAVVEVDVRLTPSFGADAARDLLAGAVAQSDEEWPSRCRTLVEEIGQAWPPFRVPDTHWLTTALLAGARAAGLDPATAVAGPSNIGCLLGKLGIPALAGFGADYRGLHGADEAIRLGSLPAVQVAYRDAVLRLLDTAEGPRPDQSPDTSRSVA